MNAILLMSILLGSNPGALYCYHQDGSKVGEFFLTNGRLNMSEPVYGQLQCYRQDGVYVADFDGYTGKSLGSQEPMEEQGGGNG